MKNKPHLTGQSPKWRGNKAEKLVQDPRATPTENPEGVRTRMIPSKPHPSEESRTPIPPHQIPPTSVGGKDLKTDTPQTSIPTSNRRVWRVATPSLAELLPWLQKAEPEEASSLQSREDI